MPISESGYDATFGSGWHPRGREIKEQLAYVTYAGTPGGNVTPTHIGQYCFDSANEDFYLATGLTSSDWKQITA